MESEAACGAIAVPFRTRPGDAAMLRAAIRFRLGPEQGGVSEATRLALAAFDRSLDGWILAVDTGLAGMLRDAVGAFMAGSPGAEFVEEELEAWDGLARALACATAATWAERFCADPDALAFQAPYRGTQTFGLDDTSEIAFRDGSHASCLDGRGWVARRLPPGVVRPWTREALDV